MPRLNKPVVAHLEKIPAKTHSGLYYRYTFQLNEADSKNLSKAAKVAGISEAEYCKRQVLKSFVRGRVEKPIAANKNAIKTGKFKNAVAYKLIDMVELFKRAALANLSDLETRTFDNIVEILHGDKSWQEIRLHQIGKSEPTTVSKACGRLVAVGLIESRRQVGVAGNEYRLVMPRSKQNSLAANTIKTVAPARGVIELFDRARDKNISPEVLDFYERLITYFYTLDRWITIGGAAVAVKLGGDGVTANNRLMRFVQLGLLDCILAAKNKPNKYRLPILSKYTPQELEQRKALNSKNGGAL